MIVTRLTEKKVDQLVNERRWEILAVLAAGGSGADMAAKFDVHWKTFRVALERIALPDGIEIPEKGKRTYKRVGPDGQRVPKSSANARRAAEKLSRNDIIVGLRKQGLPYQTIGDMYGITRERVRQILAMYDADGGFCILDGVQEQVCPECGVTFKPRAKARYGKCCSTRCGHARRDRKRNEKAKDRLRKIIALKERGVSWDQIAKRMGFKNVNSASSTASFWAAKYDMPTPDLRKKRRSLNGGAS